MRPYALISKPESPKTREGLIRNNQNNQQEQSDEQAVQDGKYLPASRSFALHPPRDDGQRSKREDAYSIHHYRGYQDRIFEMVTGELRAILVEAEIVSTEKSSR